MIGGVEVSVGVNAGVVGGVIAVTWAALIVLVT